MPKTRFDIRDGNYEALSRAKEISTPDNSLLINILGDLNYPQSVKSEIVTKTLRRLGATEKDKSKVELANVIAEEELMEFLASPYMGKIRSSSYEIFSQFQNRGEVVSGAHLASYLKNADKLMRKMHEYANSYFNAEVIHAGWPINPRESTKAIKSSVDNLLEKDFVSESDRDFHIRLEVPYNALSYAKKYFLGDETKIVLTVNNHRQVSAMSIYERWITSKVTKAESYGNKKWRVGDENSIASPLILLGQNYPGSRDSNPEYKVDGRGQDATIKSGPLSISYHYHDGGSGWGEEIEIEKKYDSGNGYKEVFPLIERYLELAKDFPRLAEKK